MGKPRAWLATVALGCIGTFWVAPAGAGEAGPPANPAAALPAAAVVDTTGPFFRYWSASRGWSGKARVRAFFETVVKAHPELFTDAVLDNDALSGMAGKAKAADIVDEYLGGVVPYVPRMRAIASSLPRELGAAAQAFKAAFPEFAAQMPVYATITLFDFDGGTRTVAGRRALVFGVDGIARYHGRRENLAVLYDHELFHEYHEQVVPELAGDDVPMWIALWREGLATYVSQAMNPGTSDAQALWSRTLPERARTVLPAAARELAANFESNDKEKYGEFFHGNIARTDIPARCGYYVGLVVAQKMAVGRSLPELAALRGEELKSAVRSELEKMAAAR